MIRRFRSPVQVQTEEPKSFDDFELRLGDLMRGERATLGKSLLDVQRELKIKAACVAAIENSDPSAFDTPGFIPGYVRSYARYLKMDPDWAFESFCTESGFEPAHGMSPEASSRRQGRMTQPLVAATGAKDPFADPKVCFVPRSEAMFSRIEAGAVGSVAVLATLIAAIGFGGWAVLKEIQQVDFAPAEQLTSLNGTASAGSDGRGFIFSAENAGPDPLAGADFTTAAADEPFQVSGFDRLYRPEVLNVPVLVPRDGPIASVDIATIGAFATPVSDELKFSGADAQLLALAAASDETQVLVTEEAAPEIRIVAVRPAWVRVHGAGDTVLFEKIMDAGEEYILPKTAEAPVLRVGESGAVYFAMGAELYGPAGASGTVTANIVLTSEALSEAYSVADITADPALAKVVAEAASH